MASTSVEEAGTRIRKTVRRTQDLDTRNFPPARHRHSGLGASKRVRGYCECFKVTADTPSVFSSPASEHQFWQSAGR